MSHLFIVNILMHINIHTVVNIYIYIYIYMNGELGDENDIFYLTGFHYNVFLFD